MLRCTGFYRPTYTYWHLHELLNFTGNRWRQQDNRRCVCRENDITGLRLNVKLKYSIT